jgi:hypothetical protein
MMALHFCYSQFDTRVWPGAMYLQRVGTARMYHVMFHHLVFDSRRKNCRDSLGPNGHHHV